MYKNYYKNFILSFARIFLNRLIKFFKLTFLILFLNYKHYQMIPPNLDRLFFNNKYLKYKYRQSPYLDLTNVQTSWIIYRMYKGNYLTSKDMKYYVRFLQLKRFTDKLLPILISLAIHKKIKAQPSLLRNYSKRARFGVSVASIIPAYILVNYFNLFSLPFKYKKKQILHQLDNDWGHEVLGFNNHLTWYYNQMRIDKLTKRLYTQRNSMLTDIYFPAEYQGRNLVDKSEYPADEKSID